MAHRDSYLEGTPSWVDLASTDVDGAKAFYSGLLGWEWESPSEDYHMASMDGRAAAGLMQQPTEQVEMGLPPLWNIYLAVENCDATVAKVEGAGGSVMAPPFDVEDAGRMAVIVDPSGAVVSLWQAGEHIGAEIVNEPGAFAWAELQTPDQGAATGFFSKLLGWDTATAEMGSLGTMTLFKLAGEDVASAMDPPMEGVPPHWQAYFAVADCDASCARVGELGGRVLAPPFDAPPGRMAAVTDPSGAVFSIIALAEAPGS